jgi:hypothetical protein
MVSMASTAASAAAEAWDQDAKNCRAPALDFLASIVSGAAATADESSPTSSRGTGIGIGIGKVLDSSGSASASGSSSVSASASVLMKSDSVKSLASASSVSSSVDNSKKDSDFEFNSNGKRTPVDSTDSEIPPQKQLKVESGPEAAGGVNATAPGNFSVANLPMPNGQIPHLNNGQFNQIAETNSQSLVLGSKQLSTASDSQFPYFFSGIQGPATEQQSLVFPVAEGFSANANSEEGKVEIETVAPIPEGGVEC